MTIKSSIALLALSLAATALPAQVWRADQGDGTYRNPVLFADYPDPDIIRVGEDFYFITTTFANAPGMTILHSKDLVNWQIAGHLMDRLEGNPRYDLSDGGDYRRGFFAASMRHHNGTFYVAVSPIGLNTRIYRAKSPTGPWTYTELDRHAFDPALFFEDNGQAYLITSIGTDGTVTLLTMNDDVTKITVSKVVHYNKGAEGSKIIKREGWYYLFNALPSKLALTVSRARSLQGPWETRPQIDDTSGGHQGALVDLANGEWVGFVMVDAGSIGRMTNISPVYWQDDWPIWGTPDAPGRVPDRARKPIMGHPFAEPPASDDFSASTLGLQWQWNHNPDDRRWSLRERPGFLRLHATQAKGLWTARNTLTQKGQGPRGRGTVKLDMSGMRAGDVCGFGTFGKISAQLSVVGGDNGRRALTMKVTDSTEDGPRTDTRVASVPVTGQTLWLRTDMDFVSDEGRVAYSRDGQKWTGVGDSFPLKYDWRTGTFQGQQFAISCYNAKPNGGYINIDSFTLAPLAESAQAARP
ncbi:MAG: glycoside hydrolase 43 family protein [Sphingobium sp.]|nr:glycoside hydrolase 43 family protein [Sphingobium sp.]